MALCLSIFLDAIQRFVEPQVVSSPKLVLIVGCFGLLSNILGLFLFHEHGHSHGGGEAHSHSHAEISTAEQGRNHNHTKPSSPITEAVADERGNVADVLPQTTVAGWPKSDGLNKTTRAMKPNELYTRSDEDESTITNSTSPITVRKTNSGNSASRRHTRRHSRGSRSRFSNVDDIHIHPASLRNEIIAAGRLGDIESRPESEYGEEEAAVESEGSEREDSALLGGKRRNQSNRYKGTNGNGVSHNHHRHDSWHVDHKHNKPKEEGQGGGGHSHGDLNMKGVFLHVMGDALGNIGVITSALIIWLTSWPGRFYADPAISLVITFIILGSAIPLCKAASRILLQAVPAGLSVDDIKEDIQELPDIVSCHHLHVWQLSDVKLVASLHIQVGFDFKGEGSARYMQLARQVRRCLHEYGIHSSTIQPEFCLDDDHRVSLNSPSDRGNGRNESGGKMPSRTPSLRSQPEACLLDCGDECDEGGQCCPMPGDGHSHDPGQPRSGGR